MNCVKILFDETYLACTKIKTHISNLHACVWENNTATCKFDNGKYLETFTIGIFKMLHWIRCFLEKQEYYFQLQIFIYCINKGGGKLWHTTGIHKRCVFIFRSKCCVQDTSGICNLNIFIPQWHLWTNVNLIGPAKLNHAGFRIPEIF